MVSQSSKISNTTFLEACIEKRKSFKNIYEALGLFSENGETRGKEPVFVRSEANEMHKKIKDIAESIRASQRNSRELLLTDFFAEQVRQLARTYGEALWGDGGVTDEWKWDNESDRDEICFHIRCWIIRHAVQRQTHRKNKARPAVIDLSDSEQPNEHQEMPLRLNGVDSSGSIFRAPPPPTMLPSASRTGAELTTGQNRHSDEESNATVQRRSQSPVTPNKRKAPSFQGQTASGKLQRVAKAARTTIIPPQPRRQNIFDGPMSPTRAPSCDTDQTWAPQGESTVDSETAFDPMDVMADTQELFSDIPIIPKDNGARSPYRSPTPGPSGTYRNPHSLLSERQDSVIPMSVQPDIDYSGIVEAIHQQDEVQQTSTQIWHDTSVPTTRNEAVKHDDWQERRLRGELFKLLVSFLNGINQFRAESYEPTAEERMDHLLYQFWINDADKLRAELGDKIEQLQNILERWMKMRNVLTTFQRTTGYLGKSGDDWKTELRRMDRVTRARASIAFVDMKNGLRTEESAVGIEPTFDDDLKMIFDLLTRVDGCNGVEEFEALTFYNEGLLEWFM